jgi:hypothetical protein
LIEGIGRLGISTIEASELESTCSEKNAKGLPSSVSPT